MTTISILPISNISGEKSYRAIAGDKQWIGKTVGQALDGLTAQLADRTYAIEVKNLDFSLETRL